MVDHRRIQRTLFRMQMDSDFAARVLDGGVDAELETAELELLRALPRSGVAVDPKGERRNQVLGNIATEFTLSITEAAACGTDDLLEAFPSSAEFHTAMAEGARLPFAFGAYAERRAPAIASNALGSFIVMERAMTRARRAERTPPTLQSGEVQLVPGAELFRVVNGLVAHADALRANVESGLPIAQFRPLQGSELVLVVPRPGPNEFALAEVHVEVLQPPVDAVIEAATQPLPRVARAELATRFGATPEELEGFVEELIADGLLTRV